MSVDARALWMRDWCDDLSSFPIEAIRAACRKYRNSGATKFPTPGQLVPMVRGEAKQEPDAPKMQPWRPIEDAEYETLSLRDKIRHHRILAHEARRKAGPMWRNGKPCPAEEMPDTWRAWNRQAEHHEDEAARLSKFIRAQPVAAE